MLNFVLVQLPLKRTQSYLFNFFQTFGDFGITRKFIFFSPMAIFTADKCSVFFLFFFFSYMVTIVKVL